MTTDADARRILDHTGRDARGWLHPRDEEEIVRLVVAARVSGRRLRVRGAGHSLPAAIAGDGDTVLVLDRFRHRSLDGATGEVTAGAGLRLGPDPLDPRQAEGTGLCSWLHERGRALPNLPGILHQTVAGFVLTGSGGGSTRHDMVAAVAGLRLVDGTGAVRVLRRGRDDDLLDAVLVSMGACGVVTGVTFRTEPTFDVAGTQSVLPDRSPGLDLFTEGPTGLRACLERSDYARVLWWPQRNVRRVILWEARRVGADDAEPVRPYYPVPPVFGSTVPTQLAAGAALWGLTHWRRPFRGLSARAARRLERPAIPIEGAVYRAFVRLSGGRPERFRGRWFEIIAPDARMDERWMPTTFSEVFIPLERAAEALRRLDRCFDEEPSAAGRFAIELYGSGPSTAWLHPSYQRTSVRINVFWLTHSVEDPRDTFLPRIWAALADFEPRLHWGKLFPHEPAAAVAGRYPRHADFLAVRAALDPDRVFLSVWLRTTLDLVDDPVRPSAPLPGARMPRPRLRWPLLFALQPSDLDLLDRADYVYEFDRAIAASGSEVFKAYFDDELRERVPGMLGFFWHTPAGEFDAAVVDEMFVYMTLRMRTVAYEPGRVLATSIDRCSMPLGRQVLQVFETTPTPGGCRVRWRIAVRYLPGMAPLAPAVTPLFRRMFKQTLDAVEQRFAAPAIPPSPDRV